MPLSVQLVMSCGGIAALCSGTRTCTAGIADAINQLVSSVWLLLLVPSDYSTIVVVNSWTATQTHRPQQNVQCRVEPAPINTMEYPLVPACVEQSESMRLFPMRQDASFHKPE